MIVCCWVRSYARRIYSRGPKTRKEDKIESVIVVRRRVIRLFIRFLKCLYYFPTNIHIVCYMRCREGKFDLNDVRAILVKRYKFCLAGLKLLKI